MNFNFYLFQCIEGCSPLGRLLFLVSLNLSPSSRKLFLVNSLPSHFLEQNEQKYRLSYSKPTSMCEKLHWSYRRLLLSSLTRPWTISSAASPRRCQNLQFLPSLEVTACPQLSLSVPSSSTFCPGPCCKLWFKINILQTQIHSYTQCNRFVNFMISREISQTSTYILPVMVFCMNKTCQPHS